MLVTDLVKKLSDAISLASCLPKATSKDTKNAVMTVRVPAHQLAFIDAVVTVADSNRNRLCLQLIQIGIEQLRENLPAETMARIESFIEPVTPKV
jgi:hypothetical protein